MYKSALVPYSVGEMYDLVADIYSYPDFLPWCRSVDVHMEAEDRVRATIEMAKGPMHKSFTTINRITKYKQMDLSLVDGPFRHLEGQWRFQSLGGAGSKISLDLKFEFSSRLVEVAIGPIFNDIANRLVGAFVERAENLYGKA